MKKNHRIRQAAGVCLALILGVASRPFCEAAPKKITLKAVTAWPKPRGKPATSRSFLEIVKAERG